MATAYAALVSLVNLIEQIQLHPARPPIFVEEQLKQIEHLKEKACFLQDYLDGYSHMGSNKVQDLERRIADASHEGEDIIESYVVDHIKAPFPKKSSKQVGNKKKISKQVRNKKQKSIQVYEVVKKVIQDMDLIAKEMTEIKDLQPNDLKNVHSSRPRPTMNDHDTMVGFDDRLHQIMDKLTTQLADLQIIPVTGMGGIGKTTLAHNVYDNSFIVRNFDVRSWVTVSQVYDIKEMLLELLRTIGIPIEREENSEYHHLGLKLFQHLSGRTYLIIVDDLWNTEAWDKLHSFFPNSKGSRVIVTTRLKDVANYVGSNNLHEIDLLDENKSWNLLCIKAFGEERFPYPELEEVGKRIARNCQGLPLSIAVIGGVLAKSNMTREFWEYVANNIDKITSSEGSACLDILLLSYRYLPIHLRPCFLYMGVYPEDHTIRVSELIKLWVAEGFLKPNKLKTMEDVAEEYLNDLVERHLIMVNSRGTLGKMKTCGIHDLMRDLCLRESHKEKFLLVNKVHKLQDLSQIIDGQRRVVIPHDPLNIGFHDPLPDVLQSTSLVRSLTYEQPLKLSGWSNFKLLRVYNLFKDDYYGDVDVDINLVNLRYLHSSGINLRSVYLADRLWNLQTLVIHNSYLLISHQNSPNIWRMRHLRHLIGATIYLPDPPSGQTDEVDVLENLQTLAIVINFRCTKEVLKRIPNVKKLKIGRHYSSRDGLSDNWLNNIGRLHKLQSLTWQLQFNRISMQNFVFPESLKKLALDGNRGHNLDEFISKIGMLPQLEKLQLNNFLSEEEWNPVEGHFLSLRVLQINDFKNLVYWKADSIHFPVLERLDLSNMGKLEEIPSSIGDIMTLQSIKLYRCTDSVVASAEYILEEQLNSGNESFRLTIYQGIYSSEGIPDLPPDYIRRDMNEGIY